MVKAQIYIEKNDLQLLKRFAAEEKIPYAQKVRELIQMYLSKKQKKKKVVMDWRKFAEEYAVPMGTIDIDEELYGKGYKKFD